MNSIKQVFTKLVDADSPERDRLFYILQDMRAALIDLAGTPNSSVNGADYRTAIGDKLILKGWHSTYEDSEYAVLFNTLFHLYDHAGDRETFDEAFDECVESLDKSGIALIYALHSLNELDAVAGEIKQAHPHHIGKNRRLMIDKIIKPQPNA